MFEVPGLTFVFYPALWSAVILACTALCSLSALVSVRSVIQPMPAALMRPRMPSGSKRLLLERAAPLWKRLSFNTRYALKSTLRNKGRFLAVLLGMCGSCALLVFALGFFNSAAYTQRAYFEDFARYDALIEVSPTPLTAENPVERSLEEVNRALAMAVTINGKECRLFVVQDNFNMQRIDTSLTKNGVLVPAYFAQQWHVDAGDTLDIDGASVQVSGVFEQSYGLSLYTSYAYASQVLPDFQPVYNTIFARDASVDKLKALSQEQGFSYSTRADDKTSFASVMKSLNTLIWFMLACAVILGLTVLYSVGLMNLSAREYEYMFMGVMGYPLKSIMSAHIKEAAMQLMFALPAGFALGYGILNVVKTAFSGDNFVLDAVILPASFACAGGAVIAMAVLIACYSMHHISGLDIVEGLKATEE